MNLYPWDQYGDSVAYAVYDGKQVGYIETDRAASWNGTADSLVVLHQKGAVASSIIYAIDAEQQAGYILSTDFQVRASVWSGTPDSRVDIHPDIATDSIALGVNAGQQVGFAEIADKYHASLWSGTAESWIDLNPANSTRSSAQAVYAGQQVGYAVVGAQHAGIWSGTAASWIDLNPAGATTSSAQDVFNGQQVGYAIINNQTHAGLWSGTSESWEDLSLVLGDSWNYSVAEGIWSDETTLYVVGYGRNTDAQRDEALLWTRPIPAPGAAALLVGGLFAAGGRRRRS